MEGERRVVRTGTVEDHHSRGGGDGSVWPPGGVACRFLARSDPPRERGLTARARNRSHLGPQLGVKPRIHNGRGRVDRGPDCRGRELAASCRFDRRGLERRHTVVAGACRPGRADRIGGRATVCGRTGRDLDKPGSGGDRYRADGRRHRPASHEPSPGSRQHGSGGHQPRAGSREHGSGGHQPRTGSREHGSGGHEPTSRQSPTRLRR